MSADFFAGYLSGAIGIVIGNPLDLLKTRIQAGSRKSTLIPLSSEPAIPTPWTRRFTTYTNLLRGAAAPILGYGALNALLFVTYNRSLSFLETGSTAGKVDSPSAAGLWTAGAIGGLATFVVSAPTELVKCRAQVSSPAKSSWQVAKEMWKADGVRGLYMGGGVTSVRDAVGYGFYFWSYEASKRYMKSSFPDTSKTQEAVNVLLCGGLAGVVTWVSIFPLDVIKTRVQTHDLCQGLIPAPRSETRGLLSDQQPASQRYSRPNTFAIAKQTYQSEGLAVFFKGVGICSARAFLVNAVQWAVYEWTMTKLLQA